MEFRLARPHDLPQVKAVYGEIVKNMYDNGIKMWDEVYPCEFFQDDIKNGRLFLLLDGGIIVSGFALYGTNSGANSVQWENPTATAQYLNRLGVNPLYTRSGIGGLMLSKARNISVNMGAEYLRLFVADCNIPAIRMYIKNGFLRVPGIYTEAVDENFILNEYGYEIKL